jgi:ppGpp synthetase/RelA/SpoT-type nucleotidyltranferase
MTVPESPGQVYKLAKPALDRALKTYSEFVEAGLQSVLTDFYVSGRVKAARSLIRKLRTNPSNPRTWESIQDKVGIRVICSTKGDLKRADKWLSSSTLRVIERLEMTASHDRLFYPGIHFIVDAEAIVDHEGNRIPCEVQLRTRAQDAWSVVSHKLLYKGLVDPPNKMKRVISRLTVVVEMFDDEVQRMMRRRRRLPVYRPATMLEALDDQFEALTGEPSGGLPDLDLMLILFHAYGSEEVDQFESIIDGFVSQHSTTLAPLIEEHQPESDLYVDSRDWLFTQPEVLCVLERAYEKPYKLLEVVAETDLEDVVRKICISAGKPLPTR